MKISDTFEYVLEFSSFELFGLFDTCENRGDGFSWLFSPLMKYFEKVVSVCHNDQLFIYLISTILTSLNA